MDRLPDFLRLHDFSHSLTHSGCMVNFFWRLRDFFMERLHEFFVESLRDFFVKRLHDFFLAERFCDSFG